TDTQKVANTSATAASTGADLNGKAAQDAARQVRQRLAAHWAAQIGADAATVRFASGQVSSGSQQIAFDSLVAQAYAARVQLWSDGFYATPGLHWNRETLKGKPFLADAPTNVRFFITLITLIVFLLLKLPGIWSKVGLDRSGYGGGGKVSAGGLTLFVGGLVSLSTPLWAGPTHMYEGYNLVYVVSVPLFIGGALMVVTGLGLLVVTGLRVRSEETARQESKL
ncbi:MAG TPA: molybdopterin-dependent oxidoreductase, partial [Anaerolineae bacterium]|nr:molybdopterin-dependent oxidoreductase [Anaerolineae bacterium]